MKRTKLAQHHPVRKALIISGVALLVIAGGLTTYVFAFNGNLFGWQPTKTADQTTSQPDKTTTTPVKETPSTTGESTNNSAKNDAPSTPPATNNLTVTLTHWSTTSVGVLITGVVNGTCTLTLTKTGATTVTMTADTFQSGSDSSTCRGFNYDELTGGGWTATVTVTADGATGTATKVIE